MKRNKYIKDKDIINLIRIAYLSKRINLYGKKLQLNQNDLDCIGCICGGYMQLIERCQNETTK